VLHGAIVWWLCSGYGPRRSSGAPLVSAFALDSILFTSSRPESVFVLGIKCIAQKLSQASCCSGIIKMHDESI
jgi:hypothetical protein